MSSSADSALGPAGLATTGSQAASPAAAVRSTAPRRLTPPVYRALISNPWAERLENLPPPLGEGRVGAASSCNEIVTRAWTRPSRPSPILRPMTERARKVEPGRLRVIAGGSPTPAPSYRLLTQVSAALSTSLDLDRTLKEIPERMNALVAFDAATIFLLDDARRELHVKAALGVPVALKEVKSFQVGEGVVGWVVRHGATALFQDSSKDARFQVTGP